MNNFRNPKKYDLEERTFKFAKNCRILIKNIRKNIINIDDCKQLIRSSGSVAANYVEANESLSKKDFIMRIKICRKESKESELWLKLLSESDENMNTKDLLNESLELRKIFGAILEKCK
jgi:four helix bundle protein